MLALSIYAGDRLQLDLGDGRHVEIVVTQVIASIGGSRPAARVAIDALADVQIHRVARPAIEQRYTDDRAAPLRRRAKK